MADIVGIEKFHKPRRLQELLSLIEFREFLSRNSVGRPGAVPSGTVSGSRPLQ